MDYIYMDTMLLSLCYYMLVISVFIFIPDRIYSTDRLHKNKLDNAYL